MRMCTALGIRFALELSVLRSAASLPLVPFSGLSESCLSESYVCLPRLVWPLLRSPLLASQRPSSTRQFAWLVLSRRRLDVLLPLSVCFSSLCLSGSLQLGLEDSPYVRHIRHRNLEYPADLLYSFPAHKFFHFPARALSDTNPLPTTTDRASSRCSLSAILGENCNSYKHRVNDTEGNRGLNRAEWDWTQYRVPKGAKTL